MGRRRQQLDRIPVFPNWVEYILERNLVCPTRQAVQLQHRQRTHCLAAVHQQATGMDMLDYAKQVLFDPLGIEASSGDRSLRGYCGRRQWDLHDRPGCRPIWTAISGRRPLERGQIIPSGGWKSPLPPKTTAPGTGPAPTATSGGSAPSAREGMTPTTPLARGDNIFFVVPELDLVTVIASHYPENSYAPPLFHRLYLGGLPGLGGKCSISSLGRGFTRGLSFLNKAVCRNYPAGCFSYMFQLSLFSLVVMKMTAPTATLSIHIVCELGNPGTKMCASKPMHTLLVRQDLNLRPSGYEPDELPNCSTPRYCIKHSLWVPI